MSHKECDDKYTAGENREKEPNKSRFIVNLVVLVNAFLFSTCFFMGNSVFPVSILVCICVKIIKLNLVSYCFLKHAQLSILSSSCVYILTAPKLVAQCEKS